MGIASSGLQAPGCFRFSNSSFSEGKRFASSKAKTDYRAVERTCLWFFWCLRFCRRTGGLFIVVVRMGYSSPEGPGVEEEPG